MSADYVTFDTFKMANGEPVLGEYEFVTGTDGWFDDIDEPVELLHEVWVRVAVQNYTIYPTDWDERNAEVEDAQEAARSERSSSDLS